MRRHLTVAAAVLAGVGLMATAACGISGNSSQSRSASTSPSPKSPKDVLIAASPDGSQGTFQCAITEPNMSGSGPVDAANKKMEWTSVFKDPDLGYQMTITLLAIDQQSWMKVGFAHTQGVRGLPKLPNKWMLLDRSKLTGSGADAAGFDGPDPGNAALLFDASDGVTQESDGSYRGTLDLTKATNADVLDSDEMSALGDRAKTVPFQATLDGSHRLSSVTINVPAAGKTAAFGYKMAYSDYGTAPAIGTPPTDQVVAAPTAAYTLLNG